MTHEIPRNDGRFARACARFYRYSDRYGDAVASRLAFSSTSIVNACRPAGCENVGGAPRRTNPSTADASSEKDGGDGDPEPEPHGKRIVRPSSDCILRPSSAAPFLGVSRATLYRLADTPGFPPKIQIGARSVGWRQSQLSAWVASREVAR